MTFALAEPLEALAARLERMADDAAEARKHTPPASWYDGKRNGEACAYRNAASLLWGILTAGQDLIGRSAEGALVSRPAQTSPRSGKRLDFPDLFTSGVTGAGDTSTPRSTGGGNVTPKLMGRRVTDLDRDRRAVECDPVNGKALCDLCRVAPVLCVRCGAIVGCHLRPSPLRCERCAP